MYYLIKLKSRVEAQIAQANANYKAAYEAGDPDELARSTGRAYKATERTVPCYYTPPKTRRT